MTRQQRRRRFHGLITLAVSLGILACGLGLSACGGSTSAATTKSSKLTVAATFLPSALDPAKGIDAIFSFEETLTRVNGKGQAVPFLLASPPKKVSPSDWRLTLRRGVTFQNGHPMTAAVVAAGLNREVRLSAEVKQILPKAKFTSTGAHTIAVRTSKPTLLLPYLLSDPALAVYDEPVVAKAGTGPDALVSKGVFTAPYAITKFTSTEMDLVAYRHYWQGTPARTGIKVLNVADAQARVAAVESGQAQIDDGENSVAARQQVSGNHNVKLKLSDKPQGQYQLWLDTAAGPTKALAVRRAIALAIDYKTLGPQFTSGVDSPASGLLPAGSPLAIATEKQDVSEANALLTKAGWTTHNNGVREKDGQPLALTLLIYTARPELQPLAIGLQTQLRKIGVQVKIKNQPFSYSMYGDPSSWDLALYHNYGISPNGVIDPFLQSEFGTGGAANYWHVSDPKLDRLIATLSDAKTMASRKTALAAVQRYIWQQAYEVTVAFERDGSVVSNSYSCYTPDSGYQQQEWNWKTAPCK